MFLNHQDSGEKLFIRLPQAEVRIKEAEKMGFTRCIVPKSNYDGIMANGKPGIEVVGVAGVVELVDIL